MALSEAQASAIITIVGNDPECKKVIPAGTTAEPSATRGVFRNALYYVQGKTPEKNPEIEPLVCTGIARLTSKALNDVMLAEKQAKKPKAQRKLPFLHLARDSQERDAFSKHTATAVVMTDGKVYVFDWHATLTRFSPLIYPSEQAFLSESQAVYYANFSGWK